MSDKTYKESILIYILSWVPAVCIMVIIFRFSASVADDSSQTSTALLDIVLDKIGQFTDISVEAGSDIYEKLHYLIRKTGHFLEYMALGCTLVLPFAIIFIRRMQPGLIRNARILLCCEITAALYACTDEFHQLFVEGRDGNIVDVGIDSLGAFNGICAGFIFWWIGRWITKTRNKKRKRH